MASAPELAPDDQNHLLRTDTVIQSIQYGTDQITYSKFDEASTEEVKMGAWKPAAAVGGRLEWNPATKMAKIRSKAKTVIIQSGK
jgi:hypothetical protein